MTEWNRRLLILWSWFVRISTNFLPDSVWTMRLRGRLYGVAMKRCGIDFQVGSQVTLIGLQNISVGNHVYIAPSVVCLASHDIEFEHEVMIAYHSVITDGNHTAIHGSYRYGPRREAAVHVGRGAWIGANCTLLPGVTIGSGTVVAANSAVSRDLPENSVSGGVPARVLSRGPSLDPKTKSESRRNAA